VPPELLTAADITEYEAISVWNVTRGTRFDTYAIRGEPHSNAVTVNGAAAHLALPGDILIVAEFADVAEEELQEFKPRLVYVNEHNELAADKSQAGRT
jgi:aspartate 1-decarboxylase